VNKALFVLAALTLLAGVPGSRAATWPAEQRFRELYQELVETNTTQSAGSCTLAAERMATRLKDAGVPNADLHLYIAPEYPRDGGLVVRRAGGDDDGTGGHSVSTVQHHLIRAAVALELHHATRDQHVGAELLCLSGGARCQFQPGDSRGEAEIVLNFRTGSRLSTRRACLDHQNV